MAMPTIIESQLAATGGVISGATLGRGGRALARHLADRRSEQHNEETRLGSSRGLLSETIEEAVIELTHITSHARSSQVIYHVHLDPETPWTDEQRNRYWTMFEDEFGFDKQPFVEAMHLKNGREHYHRAYSRLRHDGTVIPLNHDYERREKLSRIAEFEFQGRLVLGRHNRAVHAALEREGRLDVADAIRVAGLLDAPRPAAKTTPAQRHQAERTGIDPTDVAEIAFFIWQNIPTGELEAAFAARGLRLCAGNTGPILLDLADGAHSLTRVIGRVSAAHGLRIKAAEIKARIANLNLQPATVKTGNHEHDRHSGYRPNDNGSNDHKSADELRSVHATKDVGQSETFRLLDLKTDGEHFKDDESHRSCDIERKNARLRRRPRSKFPRSRNPANARKLRSDQTAAPATTHPAAWGEDEFREDSITSRNSREIQQRDTKGSTQTRRAAARNRTEDHRAEIFLEEPEFTNGLDILLDYAEMLDPHRHVRAMLENSRIEAWLVQDAFKPAVEGLEALLSALVAIIALVISALFGSAVSEEFIPQKPNVAVPDGTKFDHRPPRPP